MGKLGPVIADGFNRATFLGFLTAGFLFAVFRLFIDERITAIVVPFKIVRSRFAAKIAVNTLIIYIILPRSVFGISVSNISHREAEYKVPLSDGKRICRATTH